MIPALALGTYIGLGVRVYLARRLEAVSVDRYVQTNIFWNEQFDEVQSVMSMIFTLHVKMHSQNVRVLPNFTRLRTSELSEYHVTG